MRPRQPKVEQQRQPLLAEQLWFDEERIEVCSYQPQLLITCLELLQSLPSFSSGAAILKDTSSTCTRTNAIPFQEPQWLLAANRLC
jgi:hypothetical protein